MIKVEPLTTGIKRLMVRLDNFELVKRIREVQIHSDFRFVIQVYSYGLTICS